MQRVIVPDRGGPDRLIVETMNEELRPGPDQVLVDVDAAGVNYIDVMQREGVIKRPLPYTPGSRVSVERGGSATISMTCLPASGSRRGTSSDPTHPRC
jgi:NADPH:quinone reductase-like Zn-dependent oxidoreductase